MQQYKYYQYPINFTPKHSQKYYKQLIKILFIANETFPLFNAL